jgi:hypothetical protein
LTFAFFFAFLNFTHFFAFFAFFCICVFFTQCQKPAGIRTGPQVQMVSGMAAMYASQPAPRVLDEDPCLDEEQRVSNSMKQSLAKTMSRISTTKFLDQYARNLVSEMFTDAYIEAGVDDKARICELSGLSDHHFKASIQRRNSNTAIISQCSGVAPPARKLRTDKIAASSAKTRMLLLFFEQTCMPTPVKSKCIAVQTVTCDEFGVETTTSVQHPLCYTPFKSKKVCCNFSF